MLKIHSNVMGVIGRLDRLEAGLPGALLRVTVPARWRPVLVRKALDTLNELANEAERQYVPRFIATVLVGVLRGTGFEASMKHPKGLDVSVEEAVGIRERLRTRQYGDVTRRRRTPLAPSEEEAQTLAAIDAAIDEWVANPFTGLDDPASGKERTEIDEGFTDDEIARRLHVILFDADRTPEMDEAREGLMRRLQEFMAASAGGPDPDLASRWLLAVLQAWKETVLEQLPKAALQEIRKLRNSDELISG